MAKTMQARTWLWVVIGLIAILLAGQAIGIAWPFSPRTAIGRLLVHPWVAGIEAGLAALLVLLGRLNSPKKKWLLTVVAIIAIACAFYHMFYYLIGVEFLLVYGAGALLRENWKLVQASVAS